DSSSPVSSAHTYRLYFFKEQGPQFLGSGSGTAEARCAFYRVPQKLQLLFCTFLIAALFALRREGRII
ncbi:MAG TPA: hypothetical protein VMV75_04350, partial [Sulfuricella sp.]|nr:hypothetical protein [Sulfuricella sp.]